ncbi:EAL domain-containing protein [Sulfurimonas sp.]|uniref:EAL domain-containing protein n=1 Tax=Sulfurimonas sp. TaxID=2022749 RepID=UPI003D11B853
MKIELPKKECDYYLDELTGLKNRNALLEYIKTNNEYTLFVLDIDHFSNINNIYGYLVGDQILKNITQYLQKLKPSHGEIFRFDGDKFAFLTDYTLLKIEKEELCQIVISFFNDIEIFHNEETAIKTFFSIGVYTGSGYNLINYAYLALKEARRYKRNSFKLFDIDSTYIKTQLKNNDWISNVRRYIEEEKFVLFYQPIFNNKMDKITKYECLIRIAYGSSYITPDNFMYACKVTGILELITRFVITTAFAKFENTEYSFSINITSDDINLGYLENLLLERCKKHNIAPSRVILEILEDITTLTEPHMLSQINSLRQKGFQVALDDFGVENSNFARLVDFKPDYVKIDGLFIRDLDQNWKSQVVVQSIVDFCVLCDIDIVAEYVHNEAVFKKVREYGIKCSQGYFIGEPQQELIESSLEKFFSS